MVCCELPNYMKDCGELVGILWICEGMFWKHASGPAESCKGVATLSKMIAVQRCVSCTPWALPGGVRTSQHSELPPQGERRGIESDVTI